jgi:TQXA domain-containing protein/LPXTG-motif cell wall-anchored protein
MVPKFKRVIALLLAAAVCSCFAGTAAFAEELSGSGSFDDPEISVKVTEKTDTEGNTETVAEKTWMGESTDSVSGKISSVSGSETETVSETDNESEKVVSKKTEGAETKTESLERTETKTVTGPETTEKTEGESSLKTADSGYGSAENTAKSSEEEIISTENSAEGLSAEVKPGETKSVKRDMDTEEILQDILKSQNENLQGIEITTEEIKDESGNVIGYKSTAAEENFTAEEPEISIETEGEDSNPVIREHPPVTTESIVIELPVKPEAAESYVDGDGNLVSSTVEEIYDEHGNVIGYSSLTQVTAPDGTVLSQDRNSVWGTRISTRRTSTYSDAEKTVKQKIHSVSRTVCTKGTSVYSGQIIEASPAELEVSLSPVRSGEDHGKSDMRTLVPDTENMPENEEAKNDLFIRIYGEDKPEYDIPDADGCDYTYVKLPCLASTYYVSLKDSGGYNRICQPCQFALEDENGEIHYVYCADLGVLPNYGAHYAMTNVEDADYYSAEDAQRIKQIAFNGFWGCRGGMGSLEAVKKMMKDSGQFNEEDIAGLTEGEAMTATQAAIWKFGNSGKDSLAVDEDSVCRDHRVKKGHGYTIWWASQGARDRIQNLFDYLVNLEPEEKTEDTKFIDASDLQAAVITAGEKTEDGKYSADISFKLSALPSEKDDLLIEIRDSGGNLLETRRISGENTSDQDFETVKTDENGNYIIDGLELENEKEISISLVGAQNVNRGVYLYSAPSIQTPEGNEHDNHSFSQTFVGVGEGRRNVNLAAELFFKVKEAAAKIINEAEQFIQHRTVTETEDRTDTIKYTSSSEEICTDIKEENKSEHKWSSKLVRREEKPDESRVYRERPGGMPRTGDNSEIWLIIMLLSLSALSAVIVLKKKYN